MTSTPEATDVVLAARDIDLVRDDRTILSQVSVTVRAGEHWALLGPNGAGKSTLLRICATYAHPSRGQIDILGHRLGRVNVFELRPHDRLRHLPPPAGLGAHRARGRADRRHRHHRDRRPVAAQPGRAGPGRRARRAAGPGPAGRPPLAGAVPGRARPDADRPRADVPAAGCCCWTSRPPGWTSAAASSSWRAWTSCAAQHPDLASVLVTHHLEELPASTSHALLLRDGRVLAAGPADDVLTTELVSTCFDYPIAIARHAGRWASVAAR